MSVPGHSHHLHHNLKLRLPGILHPREPYEVVPDLLKPRPFTIVLESLFGGAIEAVKSGVVGEGDASIEGNTRVEVRTQAQEAKQERGG